MQYRLPFSVSQHGRDCFIIAARFGQVETGKWLLERGIDPAEVLHLESAARAVFVHLYLCTDELSSTVRCVRVRSPALRKVARGSVQPARPRTERRGACALIYHNLHFFRSLMVSVFVSHVHRTV